MTVSDTQWQFDASCIHLIIQISFKRANTRKQRLSTSDFKCPKLRHSRGRDIFSKQQKTNRNIKRTESFSCPCCSGWHWPPQSAFGKAFIKKLQYNKLWIPRQESTTTKCEHAFSSYNERTLGASSLFRILLAFLFLF